MKWDRFGREFDTYCVNILRKMQMAGLTVEDEITKVNRVNFKLHNAV